MFQTNRLSSLILLLGWINTLIFAAPALSLADDETSAKISFSEFHKTEPADFSSLGLDTQCQISYDNKNIFLRWEMEIDASFRTGNLTSRERQPEADFTSCEIITQDNFAYGFMFFPYQNKLDYVRDKDLSSNVSWNSNYSYTSIFTDSLWIVEAKIPVNNFRFTSTNPYNWKVVLNRYQKHQDATYSFPAISPKMGKDYYNQAQEIILTEKLAHNLNIFIRPYIIGLLNLKQSDENDKDYGVDFSFDPTASTKLKLALNPDFSDIPLDTVSDIYNSKFPLTSTENRYFFVEDIDAFNVSNSLFYSRNIRQPKYALKLNGNWDSFSFGLLSSLDTESTAYNSSDDTSYVTNSADLYNIFAFKPKSENLSAEITLLSRSNQDNDYHNEVLHFKPIWGFAKGNSIWLESNFSNRSNSGFANSGFHHKLGYNLDSQKNSLNIYYEQISSDYAADMGSITENNVECYSVELNNRLSLNKFNLRKLYTNITFYSESTLDEHKNINRFLSGSLTSSSDFNLAFNLESTVKDEFYFEQSHEQYIITIGSLWYNYRWFRPDIRFSKLHALIYGLADSYDGYWTQAAISSDLNKFTSFRLTSDHIQYFDFPDWDGRDADYWLINFDADLTFNENLAISAGARYDNYDTEERIGIFGNLQWKPWQHNTFIVGYKSSPENPYESARETIYLKSSLEF